MIYLDASVVVTALTPEPRSEDVVLWLDSQPQGHIAVSNWTLLETASAIALKRRRGDISSDRQQNALRKLEIVSAIEWTVLLPDRWSFEDAQVWTSDPGMNLRGGDALHLAIARQHDLQLATFDLGMARAARSMSIALVHIG